MSRWRFRHQERLFAQRSRAEPVTDRPALHDRLAPVCLLLGFARSPKRPAALSNHRVDIDRVDRRGHYSNRSNRIKEPGLLDLLLSVQQELVRACVRHHVSRRECGAGAFSRTAADESERACSGDQSSFRVEEWCRYEARHDRRGGRDLDRPARGVRVEYRNALDRLLSKLTGAVH